MENRLYPMRELLGDLLLAGTNRRRRVGRMRRRCRTRPTGIAVCMAARSPRKRRATARSQLSTLRSCCRWPRTLTTRGRSWAGPGPSSPTAEPTPGPPHERHTRFAASSTLPFPYSATCGYGHGGRVRSTLASVASDAISLSGALPCSTHCSSAATARRRSGPTPPKQCSMPGAMKRRAIVVLRASHVFPTLS